MNSREQRRAIIFFSFLFSLLFVPPVFGQAVMTVQPVAVSEARGLPHDSWVVVSGNIVNALPGGKNFTFRDSSGEIMVEIGSKIWRGLTAGVSDELTISGEIRVNRGQVSIRARALTGSAVVNVRQGQALTIREPITVMHTRGLPHDTWTILRGNIINALPDGKHYTFRDSSGDIVIEIDRNIWRGLSVGVSDQVQIYGEVRNNRGIVSVVVRAIRKI